MSPSTLLLPAERRRDVLRRRRRRRTTDAVVAVLPTTTLALFAAVVVVGGGGASLACVLLLRCRVDRPRVRVRVFDAADAAVVGAPTTISAFASSLADSESASLNCCPSSSSVDCCDVIDDIWRNST
jgi:hypothetical protein